VPVARAALVHDWFVQDGGAEKCAVELARLFPSADIWTTFFDEHVFGNRIDPARVHRWPVQRVVDGRRFRSLLPAYPLYFPLVDVRDAELVISSSVAFTQAVRTRRDAVHVSYVYTPMRFAWDQEAYLGSAPSSGRLGVLGARLLKGPLRTWDRWAARRPDVIVAISEVVRKRIRSRWRRDAEVIHPPVDLSEFRVTGSDDGYLLVASRLLPYKRIDLAIAAAQSLGRELVVAGDGPERTRLEAMALQTGGRHNVRLLGHAPRDQLVELIEGCHAYLVPGQEDFGIAPIEAMACGKPVVAFRAGGVTESVVDGVTGVFFDDPDAPSLAAAIERTDAMSWDAAAIRARAEAFDRGQFIAAWHALLARLDVDPAGVDPAVFR
jgi:glycosyltransferase involved in cell wall biosynthesis